MVVTWKKWEAMARIVEGIAFVQSHTMHFPALSVLAHVLSNYDTTLTL